MTIPKSMVTVLLLALHATSAQAAPCAGFTDVDDASPATGPFCESVAWIRNRGVTLGCTPTTYCPFEPVLRIQMAAFMKRLAEALFPLTCVPGQVMKWNGADWTCANDNTGGSVTSVAAGTGLQGSPNPITGSGSLSIAAPYQLPQSCGNGQVPKSNGANGWTCATDANAGGTVTSVGSGTGLTGGPITTSGTLAVNTAVIQARITGACAAGSSIRAVNADGSVACEVDDGVANAFVQGGNAFGTTAVLGTTDNQPIEVRANNTRYLLITPNPVSPNVIAGGFTNSAIAGVRGATIAGGGSTTTDPDFGDFAFNRVYDHYGSIGGGYGNKAGNAVGTVADAPFATVGGGYVNVAGTSAQAGFATIAGGRSNEAASQRDTIGGGENNWTRIGTGYAVIGGGRDNTLNALGSAESVISGGLGNALTRAHVDNQNFGGIGGGYGNRISTPASVAPYRTHISRGYIPGGAGNTIVADPPEADPLWNFWSIAAGHMATSNRMQCFVLSLWEPAVANMTCAGTNSVSIGANNGFSIDYLAQRLDGGGERWVYVGPLLGHTISTWTTAHLSDGGAWVNASDRERKDGFQPVDANDILERVAALPVTTWSYRYEAGDVRHMGPTAQDFHATFGLGADDTSITTVDAAGVALTAVHALHGRMASLRREVETLDRMMDEVLRVLGGGPAR